ncbi:MAG: hypothetical protein HYZ57_09145 [Acidobacteria bacterium]|nr:hypothetical protein [Acidobacteriota bacterium]MBI3279991.1 hypothetical protein [Acidobacteriota bacterium]
MLVELESAINPALKRVAETSQEHAPVIGYLLTPVALGAYALALWRLGADLKWVGAFFLSTGLFSHWQVWLAIGIATHIIAAYLKGRGEPGASSRWTGQP